MNFFTKRTVASITYGVREMIDQLQRHADAMLDEQIKQQNKATQHALLATEAADEAQKAIKTAANFADLVAV